MIAKEILPTRGQSHPYNIFLFSNFSIRPPKNQSILFPVQYCSIVINAFLFPILLLLIVIKNK